MKNITHLALLMISKFIIGGTTGHDMIRRYGINSHILQTSQFFLSPQEKKNKPNTNLKKKKKNRSVKQ